MGVLKELAIMLSESSETYEDYPDIMQQGLSIMHNFTEDDADPEQLRLGIDIEHEHTNNDEIAKKIALDHLCEIPDYYTRLIAMEQEAGKKRRE